MFDSSTPTGLPDSDDNEPSIERLEADLCTLAGHLAAATCKFLLLLGEFDRRSGWAAWDMPSCAAWLSWKCGMSSGTAREYVRVARRLLELPAIRAEFSSGRLSFSKVRALTRIATPGEEAGLVEMALPMTANQLERFARAHRTVTAADDEQAELRRRVTWRMKDDGSITFTVHLPPDAGATVLTALRAAVKREIASAYEPAPPGETAPDNESAPDDETARDRETEPDDETWPHDEMAPGREAAPDSDMKQIIATSTSQADALVEVAENYIAAKTRDAENPDTYQVIIHVDAETLAGETRKSSRCHVDDGPAISGATAQMYTCDALVSWMRHDSRGNVLDVGRRHRFPPPRLRRALRYRDSGRCRFPGCNSRIIEAHHIKPWTRGGRTCLKNCISLCRRHHRMIHMLGYKIEILPDGEFTFLRPDGILIPNAPPAFAVQGTIGDQHDAEISATTVVPPWYGERLNLDYAISVLFANKRVRQARAAGVSAEAPTAA